MASVTVLDEVRGGRPTCAILIDAEIYWPLTAYFRERNFSIESERAYANAVARFMVWLERDSKKKREVSSSSAKISENQKKRETKNLFNRFLHDVLRGTVRNEEDSSDLWWSPSSHKQVELIAARIASFSDWLRDREETCPLNPKDRHAQASERIRNVRKFWAKKKSSMLGHAKSTQSGIESLSRAIATPGRASRAIEEVAAFPEDRIDDLLWKGFEREEYREDPRPWVRWNLRDILITLICLYGGTRESEPLHLWVDDILEDEGNPESCRILIHHPELGMTSYADPISGKTKETTREDYLNRMCAGKKPLTMEAGRRHAGWKGNLLTDRRRSAFHVFWIDPKAGSLFKSIWSMYLLHDRPVQPKTPWAFLTKDGLPLGAQAFSDSFSAAVRKIGLEPSKWSGTTPHGLRHRYGQWLNELGISDKHGQICMHHASVASQDAYRKFRMDQVADALAQKSFASKVLIPSNPCLGVDA